MKAGLEPAVVKGDWPRRDEIPVEAAHRFMATLHDAPGGGCVAFIKGASEALLAMAQGRTDPAMWQAQIAAAGTQGERVLAFGVKHFAAGQMRMDFANPRADGDILGVRKGVVWGKRVAEGVDRG